MTSETKLRSGPLSGLRVIELAHVMAGPACGRLLADLGADVIKLERPGGEDSRHMAPPWLGTDSAAYVMMNRNKRDVCIDLKTRAGKQAFLDLARTSDVVIENFRKGTMERLGIGYEALSTANPGLIYCEISGYGRTGPMASDGGFDLMAQAMSGLMSFTGEGPGRPPVKIGAPVADIGAGMLATVGVLAALREREQSGEGQKVDTSLYEAALFQTLWQSAIHLADGSVPEALGSAHPLDGPYQAFQTADRWIVVGAANQANWLRLTKAIDAEHLAEDARYADNPARMKHLADLVADLEPIFRSRSSADWLGTLEAGGVPAAPILSMDEVASHPQALAREMFVDIRHPELGEIRTLGLPIKLSRTPGKVEGTQSPRLGQHAAEVLREAGWSKEQIEAAFAEGAVLSDETSIAAQ
ncbi:MAG: CoA transferase [Pseudomonadota bacterium]